MIVRGQVKISFPWRLTRGDDVWLGEEVMILSLANVTVGSNVCISQRAFFMHRLARLRVMRLRFDCAADRDRLGLMDCSASLRRCRSRDWRREPRGGWEHRSARRPSWRARAGESRCLRENVDAAGLNDADPFSESVFPARSCAHRNPPAELADALEAYGHVTDFIAARQDYRQGQRRGSRMIREPQALATMLFDGLRNPRPDVVISASSPPCLGFVAALIAWRHSARSMHWVMDLYPEIAIALGEIRDGALACVLRKAMGWAYRRCERVVALDADMARRLELYSVHAEVIRPFVFETVLKLAKNQVQLDAPWTWIYSGNLGRAHEWRTLLDAQALLESRGINARLLFQGGGPSRPAAQAHAALLGLKRCDWRPYLSENELPASLLRCHVNVVTQLPATQGMLWPSKLGLLLNLPRPILWVGPSDSAIARELHALPHAGIFEPSDSVGVADWIERRCTIQTVTTQDIFDAVAHRDDALQAWRKLIGSASNSSSGQ